MFQCPTCKAGNPPSAQFCQQCGLNLTTSSPVTLPVIAQGMPQYVQPQPGYPPQKTGISTGVKIGIGIAIGFMLVMGGCAACFVGHIGREVNRLAESPPQATTSQMVAHSINGSVLIGTLTITIDSIGIEQDKMLVKIILKNGSEPATFYPTNGNAVIGTMQLDAAYSAESSDLSGEIQANVRKEGAILFKMPKGTKLFLSDISKVTLHLGTVYPRDYRKTGEANILIDLPSKKVSLIKAK